MRSQDPPSQPSEDMEQISPDIEQWLLQDTQVVSRWRNLARHLGLAECLLETEPQVEAMRSRRGWMEKDKLQMLLRTWKKKNPESYNIHTLKSILLAEGLSDMWMWMNIITKDSKRPHYSRIASPSSSPAPSSPWSRYLYSPTPGLPYSFTSQSTYPESDYSHSLGSHGSRPASQQSDYNSSSPSPYPLFTSSSPNLLSTTSPSTPSSLYRPNLIQLSSPRLWIRQKNEDRARHASFEFDVSDISRNM
eukprot:TRINITY_DN28338_c0_g1_i1.p1 TRINITY_DN28338_c0_g1~~TRINITY_DN28338_c0_g1_i1.p1  ORF type:complete len:248 (+),score=52.99 TRINITY_DN28338_c0_g1_i1:143-886(+)